MTDNPFTDIEIGRLKQAAELLLKAEERLPVLRALNWDRSLSDRFFASGGKEPPRPVYQKIDAGPSLAAVGEARSLIDGSSAVHIWLRRMADVIAQTAALLAAVGTRDFYAHSVALYGAPTSPIADGKRTALELARRLDSLLTGFDDGGKKLEARERFSAEALKARLDQALPDHFGAEAPRVEVTKNVSAKAAAGPDYVKLRADALFSDLDFRQILQHEALVHIASAKNGAAQAHFPILAESHPGNARTQEGLAVFAEFISGSLDPARFKRLADRVIAIDMAASGADFMELYNFFRERSTADAPFESFESARRVVRGGLVEGGAPFTKDSVYLQGLLEVHNYLRAAVAKGDAAYVRLLFVGKFDLADLEAMKMLKAAGLLSPPRYLPPWAVDLRVLISYLAYSTFLNEIKISDVAAKYERLFSG